MNATQLFAIVERTWRAALPPSIPPRLADQFLAETRDELVALIEGLLVARRARAAQATQAADDPPELWTKARRLRANLRALQILATKKIEDLTAADRRDLLAYSGWGGLSLEEAKSQFPAGLEPDSFGLIHEYYTPLQIADAIAERVCPLLPELAGHDGVVRILEPSAGIGRFLRAMGRPSCIDPAGPVRGLEWVTVELSKASSRLLTALRPDTQHFHMPLERFVREHGHAYAGRIHLILSNPPYGERGAFASEDPNPFYRERVAYAYFLRRALDLLVPGGLGVFIVPAGFLTAERNRELRGRVLARHHLVAAFRLPSHHPDGREVFPGAALVVDVLLFRARGGELTAIDEADRFILDGRYFEQFPAHVLGKPAGELTPEEGGDEAPKPRRAWRYQIVGEFRGLPELVERPMCASCALRDIPAEAPMRYESGVRAAVAESTEDLQDEVVRAAVEFGMRIDRYLAAVADNDADRAEGLWSELRAGLLDFRKRPELGGSRGPWGYQPLREHAAKSVAAQQLLNAFTPKGELAPALSDPPKVTRRYTGAPDDVLAQAEHLFRARRRLTGAALLAFHREVGGKLDEAIIHARLFDAKWNIDEVPSDEGVTEVVFEPLDAYLSGVLWPKYDRARARPDDPQRVIQARRLLEAIGPVVFEDISDITPQQRWVPLGLVSGWISQVYNRELGPVELERASGLVRVKGSLYQSTDALPGLSADTVWILGFINHDRRFFTPDAEDDEADEENEDTEGRRKMAERRAAKAREYTESFTGWLRDDEDRRQQIAEAYNREFRGIITPEFSSDPLPIARWAEKGPTLRPHQVAAIRRLRAFRRGLVAFDVGVGKTYTALGLVAVARQEGWARRTVILVPSSIAWQWEYQIRCCLPDYRVAVIGSNLRRRSRGKNKGQLTSETDTTEERAQKWQQFQAGQVDVVILTFDALARTKVSEDAVVEYAKGVEAIRRDVALRQAVAAERKRKGKQLTERQEAILRHGVRAFVQEHLTLPEGQRFDPGILWDELGVQMLIVDEASAYKNLYLAEPREAGVPKFMGGSGEGSKRAWQLDFRAAIVRKNTGGSGIVLLTATPAKNSPLEFYNLIQMIDPRAFATRLGDAEQFIDRYIQIETRRIVGVDLKTEDRSAVTGFKNLDELRNIILTYGEFRTAKEVGLKLPTPRVQLLEVDMDAVQDAKYDRYVQEIEGQLGQKARGADVLGLLMRMSLVALHGALDEGYRWNNALTGGESVEIVWAEDETKRSVTRRLPVPEFRSPKLVACARRIAAQRQCGHIVFCEPTAVHAWLREVLVQEGVPRERIAILNAEVAKPADRVRIAREFNGLSAEPPRTSETCVLRPSGPETELAPRYDVVIANSVAYEGIDLQVRTCTIHHLDLPWTPSDLEQRNGRAYRQGNRLGTLEILYYMSRRSLDGFRLHMISGKANWLAAVLESGRRDTNNPAAQQDLSPDQLLLMVSRNPEETAKRIEEARQKALAEEKLRVAREAARLLTQASARFRDARSTTDPDKATQLRAEGHARLRQLRRWDASAWPWAPWIGEAEHVEYLVPPDGEAPVYEGLRVAIPSAYNPDEIQYYEFGRLVASEGAPCIGVRPARTARWLCQDRAAVIALQIRPQHLPGGSVPWDTEDERHTEDALRERLDAWARSGQADWRSLGLTSASDAWLGRWWPRAESRVREVLAVQAEPETVPVLLGGALRLRRGAEVRGGELVSPTLAGWQQFLALAPESGETFADLKKAGELWWARRIPQALLAAAREAEEAAQPPVTTTATTAAPLATDPTRTEATPLEVPVMLPRPRGDARAVQALQRKLKLPASFLLDGRVYTQTRDASPGANEVVREYLADERPGEAERPRLRLAVAPRDGDLRSVDLRGVLVSSTGRESAQFGWVPSSLAALAKLSSEALAAHFGVPVQLEGQGPIFDPSEPWDAGFERRFAAGGFPYRVELARRHGRGTLVTYVVVRAGGLSESAVASLDIRDEDDDAPVLEDLRWLDDRLRAGERERIRERVEESLRPVGRHVDEYGEVEEVAPMRLMVELLEQRTRALRSRPGPKPQGNLAGPAGLVALLQDLAEPVQSPTAVQSFLDAHGLGRASDLLGKYTALPDMALDTFVTALWREVLADLPTGTTSLQQGLVTVSRDLVHLSGRRRQVLALVGLDSSRPRIERITLPAPAREDDDSLHFSPVHPIAARMTLFSRDRDAEFLLTLGEQLVGLAQSLRDAPTYLADVRRALQLAGSLVDTIGCQGDARSKTLRALAEAKSFYDIARARLVEGRTAGALERLRQAMERIALAAIELGRACAEGQQTMPGVELSLPVDAADARLLGDANTSET